MPFRHLPTLALFLIAGALQPALAADGDRVWRHGASLVGEPALPPDFEHLGYANPDAPKGGTLNLSEFGTFDTFNPLPAKGELATGVGLVFETLMVASEDEISTSYGLLAEALSWPEDYGSVTYRLRENARWHDGEPVTPEDVVWSFEKAIELNPQRQFYYRHVAKAEKTGEREVTFTFDETGNRELPQIVGQLTVLPRHWWEGTNAEGEQRSIADTTLEPPLGSGPYRIGAVNPGSTVAYERVEDYWGEDLPINSGRNNFDRISYTFFADRNVEFEAFKAGNVDYWSENEAKRWANSYDFPAVRDGRVKREVIENPYRVSGVLVGFLPNLRRDVFKDPRVREALNYAYDFEEQNRTLFFGQYNRIDSYFFGTELASSGLPTGRELEILEEYRGQIPDSVFTEPYTNPVGGTPAKQRENLGKAVALLREAGYELRNRRMVNTRTGRPLSFEILLNGPIIEKVALPYAQNLQRIGIDATVRSVEASQFQNRLRSRDFDMIYNGWGQSLSPGNEQMEYWGSAAAEREGSANYMGVSDPAIDALTRKVIFAKDRDELIATTRALDHVLLAHHFSVPTYTLRAVRLAWWDRFSMPERLPEYGVGFPDTWWAKEGN